MTIVLQDRDPDKLIVRTKDGLGRGNTYRLKKYRSASDGLVVVPEDRLSDMARKKVKSEGYEIRDERPDDYKWYSDSKHMAGVDDPFTITERKHVDPPREPDYYVYDTNRGPFRSSTKLEVGETYRTVDKGRKFEFKKVEE